MKAFDCYYFFMDMKLLEEVQSYMDSYHMLSHGGQVVVGLSGGADSVCLLIVLLRLGYEVEAVHVNHMIRGAEADRDESFVRRLSEKLGIKLTVIKKDVPKLAKEMHMSEEEAGRYIRYEAFKEKAEYLSQKSASEEGTDGADGAGSVKIAVAHNKNDLAETVIYNMVRGSSLQGLAGIRPVRDRIIRPLLMTKRSDIERYLNEIGQDYITDSTNLETDYSRNKIRHQVLPVLEELNDGAVDHLAAIAMDALQLREDMDNKLSFSDGAEYNPETEDGYVGKIDIDYMNSLDTLTRGELVLRVMESVAGRRKDLTREHVRSVMSLSELESGKKIVLPYEMVAERVYGEIRIYKSGKKSNDGASEHFPEMDIGRIETVSYEYTSEIDLSKKEYTKLIDCDKIKSTLCLRTPKPGDFIVINAEGGSKKLSRYFTEAKIERSERAYVPVVADGDEVVWIVGHRLSERYKVSPATEKVTEIRYIKEK